MNYFQKQFNKHFQGSSPTREGFNRNDLPSIPYSPSQIYNPTEYNPGDNHSIYSSSSRDKHYSQSISSGGRGNNSSSSGLHPIDTLLQKPDPAEINKLFLKMIVSRPFWNGLADIKVLTGQSIFNRPSSFFFLFLLWLVRDGIQ